MVLPRDTQSRESVPFGDIQLSNNVRVLDDGVRIAINRRFARLQMDGVWSPRRLMSVCIPEFEVVLV